MADAHQGSWLPTIILLVVVGWCWLCISDSERAIGMRRAIVQKKNKLYRQMGWRDSSKYKMKAGDGSNTRLRRKG